MSFLLFKKQTNVGLIFQISITGDTCLLHQSCLVKVLINFWQMWLQTVTNYQTERQYSTLNNPKKQNTLFSRAGCMSELTTALTHLC